MINNNEVNILNKNERMTFIIYKTTWVFRKYFINYNEIINVKKLIGTTVDTKEY